jgi:cold-inducible RNA-binding protein
MNIFVGNLAKEVTDEDLQSLFSEYGTVKSVKVIKDMFSGESRGFGFVEMPGQAEAQKAMTELNTREVKGKKISVNEARDRADNRRGGGGRGGRGGGGGNRGGGGGNRGGGGGGRQRSW